MPINVIIIHENYKRLLCLRCLALSLSGKPQIVLVIGRKGNRHLNEWLPSPESWRIRPLGSGAVASLLPQVCRQLQHGAVHLQGEQIELSHNIESLIDCWLVDWLTAGCWKPEVTVCLFETTETFYKVNGRRISQRT